MRREKCLFASIQKKWNMLKISPLFKKFTNFMGKKLENCSDPGCEIFMLLFLYEHKRIAREIFKPSLCSYI